MVITRFEENGEMSLRVESKMGAVVLGFRWHMEALSRCRLSPTYHDPVSHPPNMLWLRIIHKLCRLLFISARPTLLKQ